MMKYTAIARTNLSVTPQNQPLTVQHSNDVSTNPSVAHTNHPLQARHLMMQLAAPCSTSHPTANAFAYTTMRLTQYIQLLVCSTNRNVKDHIHFNGMGKWAKIHSTQVKSDQGNCTLTSAVFSCARGFTKHQSKGLI